MAQSERDRTIYGIHWSSETDLSPATPVREFVRELLIRFRLPRIADLGCGIGRHALLAATAGAEVIAIDHDRVAIERLTQLADNLRITALRTDYCDWLQHDKESKMEGLICYDSLHHTGVHKTDLERVLRAMRQRVCTGGMLLVSLLTEIDYGSGDVPQGRCILSRADGDELLSQCFRLDHVMRRWSKEVRIPVTRNYIASEQRVVSSSYRAHRLGRIVEIK